MTSETKDLLLDTLCSNCEIDVVVRIDIDDLLIEFNLSKEELFEVLKEFKYRCFIENLNMRPNTVFLSLTINGKIFQSQGGFTSEESMQALSKKHLDLQYRALLLQYEALKSELEGLKTTNPTLAERIISLVASITTIAGFIISPTNKF